MWLFRTSLLFFLFFSVSAQAQLATSLKMNKKTYLAGEPVITEIVVTNHSGRDLTLASSRALPWLSFIVTNSRGDTVPSQRLNAFGAMKIKKGQSLAKTVDLTQYFLLSQQGNYAVSAVVRDPDGNVESSATNRITFNLNPGRTFWSQKIGISKAGASEKREMKLLTYSDGNRTKLYVQAMNGKTGLPMKTFSLGDALMLRKPQVSLDAKQNMHVMYLATPVMWIHNTVNPDGKLIHRQIHQRSSQGDPALMAYEDGSIRVVNSIPYDPAAVAKEKAKVRKASERPQISSEDQ